MRPAACSFGDEVAFFHEFLDPQFERAGFAAGELHELAEGEGFVIGKEGVLLYHEGAEEEEEPSLPIGAQEHEDWADLLADCSRLQPIWPGL